MTQELEARIDALAQLVGRLYASDRNVFGEDNRGRFRRTVADEIAKIPFGETRTYSEIAASVGDSTGPRVGTAIDSAIAHGDTGPWWRVVPVGRPPYTEVQRLLLRAEGAAFIDAADTGGESDAR